MSIPLIHSNILKCLKKKIIGL